MAILSVRNLPDEIHRALKIRAAQHGRSTEAEVRAILEQAVNQASRIKIGQALFELGRTCGFTDKDFDDLQTLRDSTPAEPLRFE